MQFKKLTLKLIRSLYFLLLLLISIRSIGQDLAGYSYTNFTNSSAGNFSYGQSSNSFTITYTGQVFDKTLQISSYAPIDLPAGVLNYVQPASMLEIGALSDTIGGGSTGVISPGASARFTFANVLPIGTAFFMQDIDANEVFIFEFLDASGNLLNPSTIGTLHISNPARVSSSYSSTSLTLSAIDNVNYAESLCDIIFQVGFVKQIRITQVRTNPDPGGAGSAEFYFGAAAPKGYIYLHKKALNETASIDFPFEISGGPTMVSPFTLNDNPAQLRVKDLGASQNGRLWAIDETSRGVYYRNANSNSWVHTSISNANRIDGDLNGDAVYIDTFGTVFKTDGVSTTQISASAAFAGNSDIGSGWDGLPYVALGGIIYRYSGTGLVWSVVTDQSATYTSFHLDVDPLNPSVCYVVVRNTTALQNRVLKIDAGVVTNIGAPFGMSNTLGNVPRDIAVNDKSEVFLSAVATSWYVYKYTGSWSTAELTSFDVSNLTGGVGGELWVTMNSGGQNFGQPTVPYYNIFTRATDGSSIYYIDDERVRTTTSNSILIPVTPGTYTVSEIASAGWDLQSIRIEDPTTNSTSNQTAGTATIAIGDGEIVNVVFQNGELNPIAMTNNCTSSYLETFGTGSVGTFGTLVPGQTSYHLLSNSTRAEDGYCKIVTTAFPDFNNWQGIPFYDHTVGNNTGRMYAVNAGYDKGEFFRRRFTGVVPGATYTFSAWAANLTPGFGNIRPDIKFQIVDHNSQVVLNSYNTGAINTGISQWNQYGFTFTATNTDIDLILSNNAVGGNGNDLAIDDISFAMTPPVIPVTSISSTTCLNSGSIEVNSPQGVSYEYSLDTTVSWQSSPLFQNLNAGIYTVYVRFAGTSGCVQSKIDTIQASICGSVFNDPNSNTVFDISENGSTAGSSLFVYLINSAGIIVDSAHVQSDGSYSLSSMPNSVYTIELSTIQYPIGTNTNTTPIDNTPPSGWVTTGENGLNNSGLGDGVPDGVLTVTVGSSSVTNQNFGIQQPPTAVTNTLPNQVNPGGTTSVLIPSSYFDGNDLNGGTVDSLTITVFPTDATSITINGITYTSGTFPLGGVTVPTDVNGNPIQPISIDPIDGNVAPVITYTVTDNGGAVSVPATITVPFTNDVPTANPNAASTSEQTPVTISVISNDTFGNDGPIASSITITAQPSNGVSTVNDGGTPNDPTDDQIVYTPNPGFYGLDSLIYQICDINGDCDTALVVVEVLPTIHANPDINQTTVNVPVSGTVATNDDIILGSTFTPLGSMSNGTLVLNIDGTYTYTPNSGFVGRDSVQYIVCSPAPYSICDTTTLTIIVSPAYKLGTNTVIAQDDHGTTPFDTPITLCIKCNDSDPQDDSLGLPTILVNPANGTVVLNPDGTVTYTPNPGFTGTDVFTYAVCDNFNPPACDTADVYVDVVGTPLSVNQTYANDDAYVTDLNTPVSGNVGLNDTDPQDDAVSFSQVTNPANGTVVFNADGTFIYTPNTGYDGPDQFIYSKCDNGIPVVCDTATVYITIIKPNAALPAILTRFMANELDCSSKLEWTTTQEFNVDYFEIMRRSKGEAFQSIGRVEAIGNSQVIQNYSFTDQLTSSGEYSYQLKVVDIDAKFETSSISTSQITCDENDFISVYPNPVQSEINLNIRSAENGEFKIKLLDQVGRIVFETSIEVNNAVKQLKIPMQPMSFGLYTLWIQEGTSEPKVIRISKAN